MLWAIGCTPSSPFDDQPHYGATLRPPTLCKISQGYGRWLAFLDSMEWLVPDQLPLARVTRARLRAYIQALRAMGNRDNTIIGRIGELHMAMKILAPGEDVAWIRKPFGVTVYATLSKRRRPMLVPDTGELFSWAVSIMDEAQVAAPTTQQLAAYRIGLFLGMLAARGRRLRSMALLRVGHELVRRDGRYHVTLMPDQVKTGDGDSFDLPDRLTLYMDHYLKVVRPTLLGDRTSDALWITRYGTPWDKGSIGVCIQRWTRRRFGVAFGPHRFRHALATTAVLRDPDHPGLASGVLATSPETLQKHYTLAGQVRAAKRFDQLLKHMRDVFQADQAGGSGDGQNAD